MDLNEAVIARRRVPLPEPVTGDGVVVARQLDAVLVSAGFKLSRELFEDLGAREACSACPVTASSSTRTRTCSPRTKR